MGKRVVLHTLGLASLVLSGTARAPTPPESYVLLTAKDIANPVDPKLEEWFQTYADNPSPFDANRKKFSEYVQEMDAVTKALMNLRYARTKDRKGLPEALKEARAVGESTDEAVKRHILFPYLLEEIIRAPHKNSEEIAGFQNALRQVSDKSCAQRKTLLKDIEQTEPMSPEVTRSLIGRISGYRSKNFRQDALRALLRQMNPKQHADLAPEIYKHIKGMRKVMDEHPWVVEKVEGSKPVVEKVEPFISLNDARDLAAKGSCASAQKQFIAALEKSQRKRGHLRESEAAAVKIDGCFRRRSLSSRVKFWRDVQAPMSKAFGFSGEEVALRRRGLILWGEDNFTEARRIFKKVLDGSREKKLKNVEEQAIYTFARIEENAGELETAVKYYDEYAQNFPKGEYMEPTLTSLILLYALLDQPEKGLFYANKLIEQETIKDIDERSTPSLSFGLYWGGRLHYELGQTEKAAELWRRVASEFYSTFYGAIGHFTLEKMVNKPLILQPVRATPFDASALYKMAAGKDEERVVERTVKLLRLGLKDEASCEITELVMGKNDYQKGYLKSLFLYAAGDWFEAIKIFSNLPRSYRHTLPAGSERLLFPRAYTEEVLKFSEKLGVDSDYIFAIIRQESVFNPRARSPVGAQGLMQLMPQTARQEAKRLRSNYVSSDLLQSILIGTKNRKVYEPETNLALGVHHVHSLMNRYKSPIFVLTAYNASPRATERWRKNIPTDDVLAFVERIPYRETRAYVKLVLRNYFYYKRWYQSPNEKMAHLEFLTAKMDQKKKDEPMESVDFSL